MRTAVLCLVVLCFFAQPVFAQSQAIAVVSKPAPAPQGDVILIEQMEDDWLKAERNTDPSALEKILSDDFVNLAPTGLAPGKAELMKNWQPHAGQAPAYTVETSDMRIYVLGDTAVAAFAKTYTTKDKGNVAHEDTTHIFTKDRGIWKLRVSRSSFH
jgi:ketosteroid isomerase-like protein